MQGAPPDDDARDREALRGALPRPASDAADTLLAALHRSRLAASMFGETEAVTVDRYIIRKELGRGGMGVVFAAEDPILAVPVALKLLQRGPAAPGDESQLQREAQALARVRGDHVVRVYSAGFFMGQPWIAMQLVDGPHLGEWVQGRDGAARPPWREILARYVEAGRGLQAIHAAGLVHRDFKPQNAVVDADGCVKVLDFGLATAVSERADDQPRLGTHRYAAPEQFLGRDLDPRSDQFSFCVALHEAIAGAPPFGAAASTGERLAAEPSAKAPRLAREFPKWLGAALQRGLAAKPEDRHPDMTALLHELTRDRRHALRVAALVGAGFLAGGLVFLLLAQAGPDERCTAVATDSWDEQRTRLALPPDQLPRLDVAVAAWRDRWQTSRDTLCKTRPRPEAAVLTARHACLGDAQAVLDAVLTRATSQPSLLGDALVKLPAPESCLDREAGPRTPNPPSPELVAHIEAELRDAETARLYGDLNQGLKHLLTAKDLTTGITDARLAARVALALAVIAREAGNRKTAGEALEAALVHAEQLADPALEVEILHERTRLDLLDYESPRDGQRDLVAAAAKLGQLGPNVSYARRSLLLAEHYDLLGLLRFEALDLKSALVGHDDAIEAYRKMSPRSDIQRRLHESLLHRAQTHAELLDLPAAIADTTAALNIAIDLHGPDHPILADIYRSLARDHAASGDLVQARTAAARARELLHGQDAGDQARVLFALATIERDAGNRSLAHDHARKAVELATTDPDTAPAELANYKFLLATLAFATDQPDADEQLQRAIEALQGVSGAQAACDRSFLQGVRGLHAVRHANIILAEEMSRADPPLNCSGESLTQWVRAQIAARRDDFTTAEVAYTAALAHNSEHLAVQQLELARLLHKHRPGDPRIRSLAAAAAPVLRQQKDLVQAAEADLLAR